MSGGGFVKSSGGFKYLGEVSECFALVPGGVGCLSDHQGLAYKPLGLDGIAAVGEHERQHPTPEGLRDRIIRVSQLASLFGQALGLVEAPQRAEVAAALGGVGGKQRCVPVLDQVRAIDSQLLGGCLVVSHEPLEVRDSGVTHRQAEFVQASSRDIEERARLVQVTLHRQQDRSIAVVVNIQACELGEPRQSFVDWSRSERERHRQEEEVGAALAC